MPPPDPVTITSGYGAFSSTTDSYVTGGTTASANTCILTFQMTTSAATCTGGLTNCTPFYGFTNPTTWGMTFGSGGHAYISRWDPVQAAALRKDFDALKTDWKRKRAEVKARRLFKRVVGEVAYRKFENQDYHEIIGFSRTRYRLRPGFRVQVMNGSEVDYELCAHLEIGIPWFDSMAVQHLMLTASKETEDKFKAAANRHGAHSPYPIAEMTEVA